MEAGQDSEALIGHKDPARALELERSPAWKALSQNHLEGRSAAFFCYGDGGADDLLESGRAFDEWVDAFVAHVAAKGRVEPGTYRAYGYDPPSHFIADVRTKWRGLRMAVSLPIAGSSPARQQEQGINHDASLFYKKGEGVKLRE